MKKTLSYLLGAAAFLGLVGYGGYLDYQEKQRDPYISIEPFRESHRLKIISCFDDYSIAVDRLTEEDSSIEDVERAYFRSQGAFLSLMPELSNISIDERKELLNDYIDQSDKCLDGFCSFEYTCEEVEYVFGCYNRVDARRDIAIEMRDVGIYEGYKMVHKKILENISRMNREDEALADSSK